MNTRVNDLGSSPLKQLVTSRLFDEAVAYLESERTSRKLTATELVALGRLILLSENHEPAEALAAFEEALAVNPQNIDALIETGYYWSANENDDIKAIDYFDEALARVRGVMIEALAGMVQAACGARGGSSALERIDAFADKIYDDFENARVQARKEF